MPILKRIYKTFTFAVTSLLFTFGLLLASTALDLPYGFKALTVLSGSMEPKVKTGGVVFIRRANFYKVGDVITFGKQGSSELPTTHRIIEIIKGKETFYKTKGDANSLADGLEVANSEVRGKVFFSIPYLGYITQMVKQPKWFFVFVILPASTLIYGEILNIVSEIGRLRRPKKGKKSGERIIEKERYIVSTTFSPYVLDLRYYKAYE